MKFTMPWGETLEIRPSMQCDEHEIGFDEQVDGIVYNVYWGNIMLPWNTETRLQASAIAFGCQFGAYEMMKKTGRFEYEI